MATKAANTVAVLNTDPSTTTHVKPTVDAIRPWNPITDINDLKPLPPGTVPLLARIRYFFITWALKSAMHLLLTVFGLFYANPAHNPDLIRTYRVRPSLPVHIFLPAKTGISDDNLKSHKHEARPDEKHLLPLYINIHGGGFTFCTAIVDNPFCRAWSDRTSAIVANLNYSKSPLHPFPVAVHDVAALTRAVIDDSSLPVDKSRVVIAGFSAGGNLALAASQFPELQDRVHAAITYYPIVDWSHPLPTKWQHRLYPEHKPEIIDRLVLFMDWAYVPAGQDRKDKLLSPCYARREELPKNICMVAAQYDMLCRESRDMIYSLADRDIPEDGWDTGFEAGGYKWMLVKGVKHGFATDFGQARAEPDEGRKICDGVYMDVHRWLAKKKLV